MDDYRKALGDRLEQMVREDQERRDRRSPKRILGRVFGRRRTGLESTPDLGGEPEARLVDVRVDRRYYPALKNHLGPMIVAANMKPRSSAGAVCLRCNKVDPRPWILGGDNVERCAKCGAEDVAPVECEITFEFDATSDETAERMGRRAVERVGVDVLASRARRGTVGPIGGAL